MSLRGLYLLADTDALPFAELIEALPAVLHARPVLVQWRSKTPGAALRAEHGRAVQALCRTAGVPLLINDDVALCAQLGADGVHLGQGDGTPAAARARLGPKAMVGVSCHDRIELARQAIDAGANYVSFGRLFPSHTKPEARPASLDTIHRAASQLAVPICAIGGIDEHNVRRVIQAGATLAACAGGIWGQPNPGASARRIAAAFSDTHEREDDA